MISRLQNSFPFRVINSSSLHPPQYVLQEYFSRPRLVILTFSQLQSSPIKLETQTAKRFETTNSNPPGPIKPSSQSTAGVTLCCAFSQPQHPLLKYWDKNHCVEPNRHF
jgi:hypothetical protein